MKAGMVQTWVASRDQSECWVGFEHLDSPACAPSGHSWGLLSRETEMSISQ